MSSYSTVKEARSDLRPRRVASITDCGKRSIAKSIFDVLCVLAVLCVFALKSFCEELLSRKARKDAKKTSRSTRREREDNNPQHKPQQREDQTVTEELPEIHTGDSGNHHIPERRDQIAHMITHAQRQKPPLHRDAGSRRRRRGDKALNNPLPATRRNKDRHNRS